MNALVKIMSVMSTPGKGLVRVGKSGKAWMGVVYAALCAGVATGITHGLWSEGIAQFIIAALGGVWAVIIGGSAVEDAAKHKANGKADDKPPAE